MKFRILIALVFVSQIAYTQSKIIISSHIQLPKDSIESTQLISDLNVFLLSTQKENKNNTLVLPTEKVETYILLDEFKDIENSRKFNDTSFYNPYLTNIIQLTNNKYLIQISHIGVHNNEPYLRTVINLIAHKLDKNFLFSSPLIENTKNWKSKTIDNYTFYYKKNFNEKNAAEYVKKANKFDEKLNSNNKITKIYCTENRTQLLKLIGIDYKLDYNGRKFGTFSSLNENEQLIILGNNDAEFDNFGPHDLWHDRLNLVVSRRETNRPVDEGCAYLYGGSWGMSWSTIYKRFMMKIATDEKSDWVYYKENSMNFGESDSERLIVDYVINALLIKKIEKEKGFSGVWKLLNCGKFEKENKNYYKTLEEVIGITKKNYNREVWKLIDEENILHL